MSLLPSVWKDFLIFFTKENKGLDIVFASLRQLKPSAITEKSILLDCDSVGVKMYLEKRKGLVEKNLFLFFKKKVSFELRLVEKIKKKEVPLFSFEPTIDDLFIKAGLHNKYRFNNFAVSSTNQVAYAAAQAVAQKPGSSYNPLFFYGGVGVGKTHLAQAIARHVLETDQTKKIFFCPGDLFINELIDSIRERSTNKFRKKYRNLNILIVDDIQFIAGKDAVQEEFFHTFNSIVAGGGQIILTSDKPPEQIKKLEDRLRSRFSGGLIVDIQPPDYELRAAILLIKAREKDIEIDTTVARIIAEKIIDPRALEGILLSIYAKTLGKKEKIDIETVEEFFAEKLRPSTNSKKNSPHDIIKTVCSYYNIKQALIRSGGRARNIVLPRQIIMFLLRRELGLKYEEIAFLLKRKDHTTIIHGENKINARIINDDKFKKEVDGIISLLYPST